MNNSWLHANGCDWLAQWMLCKTTTQSCVHLVKVPVAANPWKHRYLLVCHPTPAITCCVLTGKREPTAFQPLWEAEAERWVHLMGGGGGGGGGQRTRGEAGGGQELGVGAGSRLARHCCPCLRLSLTASVTPVQTQHLCLLSLFLPSPSHPQCAGGDGGRERVMEGWKKGKKTALSLSHGRQIAWAPWEYKSRAFSTVDH